MLGHFLPTRHQGPDPAQRIEVDLIPRVVSIAVLDQRVADDVGFAIRDEFEIVPWLDAQCSAQFGAHRREAQLDVVVTEENGQPTSRIQKPVERREHARVPADDGFEFADCLTRISSEGRPGVGLLSIELGEKIDRIAVQNKFARAVLGNLLRQALDEANDLIGAGTQAEAALPLLRRHWIRASQMKIGNNINSAHRKSRCMHLESK
nr:hypothetical protein [Bradyrhizobium japonicum]